VSRRVSSAVRPGDYQGLTLDYGPDCRLASQRRSRMPTFSTGRASPIRLPPVRRNRPHATAVHPAGEGAGILAR
jgi:hypothetical protein